MCVFLETVNISLWRACVPQQRTDWTMYWTEMTSRRHHTAGSISHPARIQYHLRTVRPNPASADLSAVGPSVPRQITVLVISANARVTDELDARRITVRL